MIAKTLIKIRISLGYSSARAFYMEVLKKRGSVAFNYNYYTKIENEMATPSGEVIKMIAKALEDPTLGEELIVAYCTWLFPENKHLFGATTIGHPNISKKENKVLAHSQTLQKQRYLTDRQVVGICTSEDHYYLFLLVTLARVSLDMTTLKKEYFKDKNLESITEDLQNLEILYRHDNLLSSSVKELKFPPATIPTKELYKKMDIWDSAVGTRFNLSDRLEKRMIRRISSRYRDVLYNTANLLIDLIRVSDETAQSHNDSVISFSLIINEGKVLG